MGQSKNWHFLLLDYFVLCSVYFDNYHFLLLGIVQIGGRIRQLDKSIFCSWDQTFVDRIITRRLLKKKKKELSQEKAHVVSVEQILFVNRF